MKSENGEPEAVDLLGKQGKEQMYPIMRFLDSLPNFDHLKY